MTNPRSFDLTEFYEKQISSIMDDLMTTCELAQMPCIASVCFKCDRPGSIDEVGSYNTLFVSRHGWLPAALRDAHNELCAEGEKI